MMLDTAGLFLHRVLRGLSQDQAEVLRQWVSALARKLPPELYALLGHWLALALDWLSA